MAYKQKIIKSFNSSAYSYNTAADIQPYVAEQLALRLHDLKAQSVLEIGCGTGLLSQYLPRYFSGAAILLTDIAPAMVEHCQQRMSGLANIRFQQLDGEAICLTEKFDLITSCMTFHWFLNLNESLEKIISQLNPGGHLLFSALGENSLFEWREICDLHAIAATPQFISQHSLQQLFPGLKIQVELVKQFYSNAYDFLTTLKLIGARAPHIDHLPSTSGMLRRLMRLLDEKYPHGINMTYEIINGYYEKT